MTKNWSWGHLWKGLRWRLYSKSCHDGHLKGILVIMQYCKFILMVFELCIYICMIMHLCIRQTHTHTPLIHIYFYDILKVARSWVSNQTVQFYQRAWMQGGFRCWIQTHSYVVGGSPTQDGSGMGCMQNRGDQTPYYKCENLGGHCSSKKESPYINATSEDLILQVQVDPLKVTQTLQQ